MITAIVFIFGLLVGSFLNVCIVRLPRGGSIVSPPSHCPRCKQQIRFYDNVPLISFLLLRGKCRKCGLPISWRYPLVELMNAVCFVWIAGEFGINGEAILLMAFCSSLIVITFIDIDFMIIPDVIVLPGILLGVTIGPFFLTALNEPLPFQLGRFMLHAWPYFISFLNSVFGMFCGALPLLIIGWGWEKLRHEEGMGGGDVKLMGMVGAFLGWRGAFLTIFLGAIVGSIVGITLMTLKLHKRGQLIPFGPFLALGAVTTAFYGPDIIQWYLGLMRI